MQFYVKTKSVDERLLIYNFLLQMGEPIHKNFNPGSMRVERWIYIYKNSAGWINNNNHYSRVELSMEKFLHEILHSKIS